MAGRAHVQKGIWDVILGGNDGENRTFLRFLTVTDTPHLFHYSLYLVAEVDQKPAAALGGMIKDRRIRRPAGSHAGSDPRERTKRTGPGSPGPYGPGPALVPESLEGAWIIDSVATLPEYRGLGLAGKLLDSILARGWELGFKLAQINIYLGNVPAQRLYENMGLKSSLKNAPRF